MPVTDIRFSSEGSPITRSEGASGSDRFREHNYAIGYIPPRYPVPAPATRIAFARDSDGYACLVKWFTDVGVGVLLVSEAEQRGL